MKKGLKFGAAIFVALGLLAIQFITSNNNVEAVNTLKLTLTSGGTTTCGNLEDYEWTTGASISDQTTTELSKNLTCTFYKTGAETVSLKSSNIGTINASNVKLTTSACSSVQGTTTTSMCRTNSSQSLSSAVQIMNKTAGTIGSMTQAEKIKIVVPAGTPQGVYTGSLTITIG